MLYRCNLPPLLHIDQVSSLTGRAIGGLLGRAPRVCLISIITLVLNGFGAAVWVAIIVKEAAEGELVEGVFGVFAIAEPAVECVVETVLAIAVAAPQFVGVHGVKVGGVCGVGDDGDVGRHLLPQVAGEVDGLEERVSFDFIRTILAKAIFRAAAQFNDEIRCLGAELGWRRNVQHALPVYHLV